jgi:hypothetical protein
LQNLRISNKSNKIFSNIITFTQFPTSRRCRSSAAWLPAWPPASTASRRASCDWVSCNFARSEVVSCLPRADKGPGSADGSKLGQIRESPKKIELRQVSAEICGGQLIRSRFESMRVPRWPKNAGSWHQII